MKKLLFIVLVILIISGCQQQPVKKISNGPNYKDFVTNKDDLRYTVTYDVNTKSLHYTMKQYYGGPDKVRTDNIIGSVEARQYFINNKIYSCNKQKNEWQCLELNEKMVNDYIAMFKDIENNPEKYSPVYIGKESIAGTDAYCFNIQIKALLINSEQCFSKEGVPLLMKFGSFANIKAKEYKLNVIETDFSLPVKPVKMKND